jgi:predicted metal-binding protein
MAAKWSIGGLPFQYVRPLAMKRTEESRKVMSRTRNEFQEITLKLEDYLRARGAGEVWGLIGGPCGLCSPCGAKTGEPCRFPEKARASLEAVGVNVIQLLTDLGMDGRFHKDRVTWTGAVLFGKNG